MYGLTISRVGGAGASVGGREHVWKKYTGDAFGLRAIKKALSTQFCRLTLSLLATLLALAAIADFQLGAGQASRRHEFSVAPQFTHSWLAKSIDDYELVEVDWRRSCADHDFPAYARELQERVERAMSSASCEEVECKVVRYAAWQAAIYSCA